MMMAQPPPRSRKKSKKRRSASFIEKRPPKMEQPQTSIRTNMTGTGITTEIGVGGLEDISLRSELPSETKAEEKQAELKEETKVEQKQPRIIDEQELANALSALKVLNTSAETITTERQYPSLASMEPVSMGLKYVPQTQVQTQQMAPVMATIVEKEAVQTESLEVQEKLLAEAKARMKTKNPATMSELMIESSLTDMEAIAEKCNTLIIPDVIDGNVIKRLWYVNVAEIL
eukprot:TRINITY_DN9447_c0_g4_i1.p1 TRINITY_DN9447_c0_g4~~TRINITY_DN9447_c0_g4_i1.p1  ORF type:complete len:231 (-),score=62.41 TRINITY_DN9447_c0_g4_i1:103-795(-)